MAIMHVAVFAFQQCSYGDIGISEDGTIEIIHTPWIRKQQRTKVESTLTKIKEKKTPQKVFSARSVSLDRVLISQGSFEGSRLRHMYNTYQ